MAENQEVENDKSDSIKNSYEENSDKIEAGLGGNLEADKDEEEMIKEPDKKDFSVAVDLTKSLKEWPAKDRRGQMAKLTGSADPVKLARQLLKRMENIDGSEPANSISNAKILGTGQGKTDGHSVESRSNGTVPRESARELAGESDGKSNFEGVIIKNKNEMESINPCESKLLQNGRPVTPKHPKPVPDSGTEPQSKKYRCSICGRSFSTFQGMGGHKGHHLATEKSAITNIPD